MAFSSYFEATPPRKRESVDGDEVPVLVFRPFAGAPKVFFKNVTVGEKVTKTLLLRNPQTELLQVELLKCPPAESGLLFGCRKWEINPHQDTTLEIVWQPKKEGKSIHTIHLATNANARFFFSIICVSVSKKPLKKKGKVTQSTSSTSQRVILRTSLVSRTDHVKKSTLSRESVSSKTKLSSKENPYSLCAVKHSVEINVSKGEPLNFPISTNKCVQTKVSDAATCEDDLKNCSSETYDVTSPGRNLSSEINDEVTSVSTFTSTKVHCMKKDINMFADVVLSPILSSQPCKPRQGSARETFVLSTPVSAVPEIDEITFLKPGTKVFTAEMESFFDDSLHEESSTFKQIIEHKTLSTPLSGSAQKNINISSITKDVPDFLKFNFSPVKEDPEIDISGISEIEERLTKQHPQNKTTLEISLSSFTPLQINKHGCVSAITEKTSKNLDISGISDISDIDELINQPPCSRNTFEISLPPFTPLQISKHGDISSNIEKLFKNHRNLNKEFSIETNNQSEISTPHISIHNIKINPSVSQECSTNNSVGIENSKTMDDPSEKMEVLVNKRKLEQELMCETTGTSCSTLTRVNDAEFQLRDLYSATKRNKKTHSMAFNRNARTMAIDRKADSPTSCVEGSSSVPRAITTNYFTFSPPQRPPNFRKENLSPQVKMNNHTRSFRKPLNENFSFSGNKGKQMTSQEKKVKKDIRYAIPKLLLSAKKKIEEKAVTLMDTDKILAEHVNPSFCITATNVNPFINSAVFCDLQWFDEREKEFVRWLNVLLTPPEQLNSSNELPKVDVADLWKKSCNSELSLAPSRETVSSRFLINHRLDSVRRKSCAMFRLPSVAQVLSKVIVQIEKGILSVRKDRNIIRDISLKTTAIELLLCYNPLWLRIGLETIMGRTIPLESNSDRVGLIGFIAKNILSDPYLVERYAYAGVTNMFKPGFEEAMKKHILKKFFLLVYFLDYAKENKLIFHNPCLFCKNAQYKESRELLLAFAREYLSGIGDITKHLRNLGYIVKHKQTYLDEFNYAVRHLGSDLRDGVRLTKVTEIILQESSLSSSLRTPAISKLQKMHNVKVALTALSKAGHVVEGDITAKDIVEGHREKTMSLLWQIIYKFQLSRFTSAANSIQNWYRSLHICISRRIWLRKEAMRKRVIEEAASVMIQKHWRGFKARKLFRKRISSVYKIQKWYKSVKLMKEKQTEYLKIRCAIIKIQKKFRQMFYQKKIGAVVIIQQWYRACLVMRKQRMLFINQRTAAQKIQTFYRHRKLMQEHRKAFKEKRDAILKIQQWYCACLAMRRQRMYYIKLQTAALTIQTYYRGRKMVQQHQKAFKEKKDSILKIQQWYRACLAMRRQRMLFVKQRTAAQKIQSYYRSRRLMQQHQKAFNKKRNAILKIQQWYLACLAMRKQRMLFVKQRTAAQKIQSYYRSRRLMQQHQKAFNEKRNAILKIQQWYHACLAMRKQRMLFVKQRTAAQKIQSYYRSRRLMQQHQTAFNEKRNAILKIQQWYLACLAMRKQRMLFVKQRIAARKIQSYYRSRKLIQQHEQAFKAKKDAVVKIQMWYRCTVLMRQDRTNYLKLRCFAIKIQSWFRAIKLMREQRNLFLSQRNSVVLIQQKFRALCLGRELNRQYNLRKQSVLKIQRWYRSILIMRQQRLRYLEFKQKEAREKEAMQIQSNAAVKIQKWYRARREIIASSRRCNNIICSNENSLSVAETKEKGAVRVIEKWYYSVLHKKREAEMQKQRQQALLKKSVTKIQAWWRGIQLRKKVNISHILPHIETSKYVIDERFSLRAMYSNALSGFQSNPAQSYTVLLNSGLLIESAVRLSPEICEEFLLSSHLDTVIILLGTMNRSLPAENVLCVLLKIVTHVLRHPLGIQRVMENQKIIPTLVDLSGIWCAKRTEETFCHLCTVWWLLGQDCTTVQILNSSKLVSTQLLKCYTKAKTWHVQTPGCVSATPKKCHLPALSPWWCSKRTDRPRIFENGRLAIIGVLKKLHIGFS